MTTAPGSEPVLTQRQLDHKACAAMVSAYGTAGMPGEARGLLEELEADSWFQAGVDEDRRLAYNALMGVLLRSQDWEAMDDLYQYMMGGLNPQRSLTGEQSDNSTVQQACISTVAHLGAWDGDGGPRVGFGNPADSTTYTTSLSSPTAVHTAESVGSPGAAVAGVDQASRRRAATAAQSAIPAADMAPPPRPDASTLSMYISSKLAQRQCEQALALSALAHRDPTFRVDAVLCGTMVSAFVAAGVPQSAVGVLRELWEKRGVTMDSDRYQRLKNALWRGGFIGEAKEVQALMKKAAKQKLHAVRM